MTEKHITLTALTFTVDSKAVAHGVLIREPERDGGRTVAQALSSGTLQMGALRREKGFTLGRAEARMEGVGRMEAVFTGERFLLAKKAPPRAELLAPLRRIAVR